MSTTIRTEIPGTDDRPEELPENERPDELPSKSSPRRSPSLRSPSRTIPRSAGRRPDSCGLTKVLLLDSPSGEREWVSAGAHPVLGLVDVALELRRVHLADQRLVPRGTEEPHRHAGQRRGLKHGKRQGFPRLVGFWLFGQEPTSRVAGKPSV